MSNSAQVLLDDNFAGVVASRSLLTGLALFGHQNHQAKAFLAKRVQRIGMDEGSETAPIATRGGVKGGLDGLCGAALRGQM